MPSPLLSGLPTLVFALTFAFTSTAAWAEDAKAKVEAEPTTAPVDKSGPRTVLVADLVANNVDASTVDTIGSLLAGELAAQPGLSVVAGSELRSMLEFEAEKQSAGCESDASCLAEVAGAMGAGLLVTGQVGTLGTRLILTLTLMDVQTAKPVGRSTIAVDDVAVLPEKLHEEIPKFVAAVVDRESTLEPVAASPEASSEDEGGGLGALATWGGYGALGSGAIVLVGGLTTVAAGAFLTGMVLVTEYQYTQAQGWDGSSVDEKDAINTLLEARDAYGDAIDTHNQAAPWLYGIGATVTAGGLAVVGAGAGLLLLSGEDAE